jgi:lipid A 3-O-deacylase
MSRALRHTREWVIKGLCAAALACFTPAVSAQPAEPAPGSTPLAQAPDPCNPRDRERVKLGNVLTDSEHVVGHKLLVENDMNSGGDFLSGEKSDRWYTSGIKLISMLKEDTRPYWFSNALPDFACWWGSKYQFQFGYVLGHMMYTPADISNPNPQTNDRFWGAWAYLGAIVQFRDKVDNKSLQTFEFDIGFVGKPAFGGPVQKGIHSVIGSPQPHGWDLQLKTEPAVNVTYLGMRKLTRDARGLPLLGDSLKWDATLHGGFAVGTVFDYLNGGLTLRVGNSLAGTPIGTIEVPSLGGGDKWQEGAWYAFFRLDTRATAHNIFLDGSLFRDDPHPTTVEPKVITHFLNRGITYESSPKNRWTLSFNRRSREFNVTPSDRGVQHFVTLVWEHRFR